MHLRHPHYGPWLLNIQRPIRYVGQEHGAVTKNWSAIPHRMALAFPDLYEIGMSHMGLRVLYGALNTQPDLLCERVFMPWDDMEHALRARDLPLVSLENSKPLQEFDLLGFSLQYELTYTNCLAMLDLAGIPLRSADRGDPHPLVVGGGPVASHPEPMAPFFDLLFMGEAEEWLPLILRQESSWRAMGIPRQQRLERLSRHEPVYVPSLHPPKKAGRHLVVGDRDEAVARRVWVEDLTRHPHAGSGPVPATEAVFDRISLEIMRGCTQGCRFCQAGMIYRPVRERTPEETTAALRASIADTGWDEASLTALSPADHSRLLDLFEMTAKVARGCDASLSISSLRAYGLEGSFLDDLRTGRGGGLTFAPEGGTQKMRDLVNKNVSTEELEETIRQVAARGWSRIKLYFMIGLPLETDEDVEAIVSLGVRLQKAARAAAQGRPPKLTLSVSTFVPKPHTPLQWATMIPRKEVSRRQNILRRAVSKTRLGLRFHPAETTFLEAVVCRGDRLLADVIETAYKMGARFDGWEEKLDARVWKEAFSRHGIDPNTYLEGYSTEERLPWDHLHMGVAKRFLEKEYHRALQGHPTPPCGMVEGDPPQISCHSCGVRCDLKAWKTRLQTDQVQSASIKDEGTAATSVEGPDARAEPLRYRVFYKRTGATTLWGHLALVRHFPRTLRRAGLQLFYSKGFHPKPQITYTPPLPLGWSGKNEVADVKLHEPPKLSPTGLLERLNEGAPRGLEVFQVTPLAAGQRAVSKAVAGMKVTLRVSPAPGTESADPAQRAREFMARDELLQEVQTKRRTKTINLRELFTELTVRRVDPPETSRPSPEWVVELVSPSTSGGRVLLILNHLFDAVEDLVEIEATRTLILNDE